MTVRRVHIRPGSAADETEFLDAVERSRALHHPWVQAPHTPQAYRDYLSKHEDPRGVALFIWSTSRRNWSERQPQRDVQVLSKAYLGYYESFRPDRAR